MEILGLTVVDPSVAAYADAVLSRIANAPVANVAPVKHGRWEISDIPCERFKCSVCGGGAWYYDYEGDVSRSRFCPNCGAKMDGELDEEDVLVDFWDGQSRGTRNMRYNKSERH